MSIRRKAVWGVSVKSLPLAARVFVWARHRGRLRPAVRVLSRQPVRRKQVALPAAAHALVGHVGLQGEPAARAQRSSTMSVSYAVDFASLLLLGPNETMIVAAASAWSQCTFRIKERNPLLPHALQHGVPGHHGAGRRRGLRVARRQARAISTASTLPKPLVGAATTYFLINTVDGRDGDRAVDAAAVIKVWNENFLWSAPSYFVGAGAAALAAGRRRVSVQWLLPLAAAPLYPDLSQLQGLPRPDRRRAAARARDGRPAPGDDRSAGARDRREGSDVAVAHPPRAALRRGAGARAGDVRERHPGRQDGGAAARHRQARGARAHPVEARAADARRVPEDPRPSEGRRRHHQRGAVPVSRWRR